MIQRTWRLPAAACRRAYATGVRRSPRPRVDRRLHPSSGLLRPPEKSPAQAQRGAQSPNSISDALRDASPQDNSLLSPVSIAEDPNGVLNERHPAAGILMNSALIVQRQLELMNVMLGFEQANKYVIMDPQGNHIGFIAEQELGLRNVMARQWFRTHRSFVTHVFDKNEREVLRFHRPFSWISSRIRVFDPLNVPDGSHSTSTALESTSPGPLVQRTDQGSSQLSSLSLSDMRVIGEAQQQWAPIRRKYNLFLFRQPPNPEADFGNRRITEGNLPLSEFRQLQVSDDSKNNALGEYGQFAYVDEPWLSWDFSLFSADSRLIGSINRNFAGIGRELFTDTGVYALRMDAARSADEPRHLVSQSSQQSMQRYEPQAKGMTLDQRAVMLATAVSVDFDYFSRHSGSGGVGFLPLWFPGGGEAAGGAAAGEAGVGAAEGGSGAAGAIGNAAKGPLGAGEGAVAGAGTVAGYEAMQRGVFGGEGSSNPGQYSQAPPPSQAPPSQEAEKPWWEDDGPPGSGSGGSAGGGGDGGGDGGGGGGGGGFDIGDWF